MIEFSVYLSIFILLSIIFFEGLYKGLRFGMLELHLVFVGLYFGIYTVLDILINSTLNISDSIALLTLTHVNITVVVTIIFIEIIFNKKLQYLSIIKLKNQYIQSNRTIVIYTVFIVLLLNILIYYKYGFLFGYSEDILDKLGLSMPSFVSPLKVFFEGLLYGAFIFFILNKNLDKKNKIFNYLMLFIILMLVSQSGRRSFMNLIIIGVIFTSLFKSNKIYTFKSLTIFSISIFIILIFSNIFQTYRQAAFQTGSYDSDGLLPNIFYAASNFQATIENLSARTAMWILNGNIIERLIFENYSPMMGEIGIQAFANSVPSIFNSTKTVIDTDHLMAEFFGFQISDYPTNNFAMISADFGFISVLLYPLTIIIPLFLLNASVNISSTFTLFLSGFIIRYIVNIENSPGDLFILLRDAIILYIIFFILKFICKSFGRVIL